MRKAKQPNISQIVCLAFPTPQVCQRSIESDPASRRIFGLSPRDSSFRLRLKALKQSNRLFLAKAYSVASFLCQVVSRRRHSWSRSGHSQTQIHNNVCFESSVKSLSSRPSFHLPSRFRQSTLDFSERIRRRW